LDDQRIGHLVTVAAILSAPVATTFFGLTATVNPTGITESGTTSTITTTGTATITPSGGTAPYTYQWLYDDLGDGIQATAPTSATTHFKKTSTLSGDVYSSSFVGKVTDALGASATTADCAVTISRT
jgi:hypothetical protein